MVYSENDHKHNFSVWAGARAAQRGFAKVEVLRDALEQSGVVKYANKPTPAETPNEFNKKHIEWCSSICDYLEEKGIQNVSYGRAAKLISVYLKSMVVLQNLNGGHAKYIHPPVDRILLQNLSRKSGIDKELKKYLKSINWTQLNQKQYFTLIDKLKNINGEAAFWKLEKYWTVTND